MGVCEVLSGSYSVSGGCSLVRLCSRPKLPLTSMSLGLSPGWAWVKGQPLWLPPHSPLDPCRDQQQKGQLSEASLCLRVSTGLSECQSVSVHEGECLSVWMCACAYVLVYAYECMWVFLCVCMHIGPCSFIHAHTYMSACAYVHTHMQGWMRICISAHISTCTCVNLVWTCILVHVWCVSVHTQAVVRPA